MKLTKNTKHQLSFMPEMTEGVVNGEMTEGVVKGAGWYECSIRGGQLWIEWCFEPGGVSLYALGQETEKSELTYHLLQKDGDGKHLILGIDEFVMITVMKEIEEKYVVSVPSAQRGWQKPGEELTWERQMALMCKCKSGQVYMVRTIKKNRLVSTAGITEDVAENTVLGRRHSYVCRPIAICVPQ